MFPSRRPTGFLFATTGFHLPKHGDTLCAVSDTFSSVCFKVKFYKKLQRYLQNWKIYGIFRSCRKYPFIIHWSAMLIWFPFRLGIPVVSNCDLHFVFSWNQTIYGTLLPKTLVRFLYRNQNYYLPDCSILQHPYFK